MPDVQGGDILQVSFRGLVYGQRMITILHYRAEEFSTTTELQQTYIQTAAQLQGGAGTPHQEYMDCLASSYTNAQMRVQKIYPTRMIHRTFTAATVIGQVSGAALSPGTSGSITKRGEVANRHSIGGVRMPAVPLAWSVDGMLSATGTVQYADFASTLTQLLTLTGGLVLKPIIFNRTTPVDSQSITTLIVQDTIRTMSRRVLRRGE
jgi:hypothetical protein